MSPHITSSLIGSHIDGPPSVDVPSTDRNGLQSQPPSGGHVNQSHLKATAADDVHDLVCVGFGPASLAIATALHDSIDEGRINNAQSLPPKVLFLEKQVKFAWHAGMLLPGAKMQISFIKDMASFRNPRSEFTFLNFLHRKGRLVDFTNLGTFLPARVEYEEYLRWCAEHFNDVVHYQQEVVSVTPVAPSEGGESVSLFDVTSRNAISGEVSKYRARNVILAIGGQPNMPKSLATKHPRILHSSQYAHSVPKILTRSDAPYRVAVIGAGQSAAEIFSNVQTLYPNSQTYLVMRSEFLKPSDDSPFVNSIFNPSYIDTLYPRSAAHRKSLLADARSTNYAVVRLELIEKLYERMYEQRRELGTDERRWPHRILGATDVVGLESGEPGDEPLRLHIRSLFDVADGNDSGIGSVDGHSEAGDEILDVDLIIAATGYQRKSHLTIMDDVAYLLPGHEEVIRSAETETSVTDSTVRLSNGVSKPTLRNLRVARDYSVQFAEGKVAHGSGIWLQGCNEGTHGLSDTLLSVLATRSGEIVDSIFGGAKQKQASGA